ncbi:MAG: hypothetical protein HPY79_07435 [Bacteroidales bacterium]|nr:hypothetical protein [Bacteroidales bacterium]
MRIQNFTLIFAFVLLIASCSNDNESKKNVSKETTFKIDTTGIFRSYLKHIFNLTIPESKHCYYIISNSGCFDCIKTLLNETIEKIKTIDKQQLTFIMANERLINTDLTEYPFRLNVDSFAEINELALPITNVTLIYTSQKKVDSILPLKWEDQTRIIELINIK